MTSDQADILITYMEQMSARSEWSQGGISRSSDERARTWLTA